MVVLKNVGREKNKKAVMNDSGSCGHKKFESNTRDSIEIGPRIQFSIKDRANTRQSRDTLATASQSSHAAKMDSSVRRRTLHTRDDVFFFLPSHIHHDVFSLWWTEFSTPRRCVLYFLMAMKKK